MRETSPGRASAEMRAPVKTAIPATFSPTTSHSQRVERGDEPTVDPLTTSTSCYIHVSDADTLHAEWERTGVEHDPATGSRLVQPWDTDYGLREFALVDKSGNLVRVGSPLRR